MTDKIKLPPLPEDDIEHDGYGKLYKYGHSDAQLRARDLEVVRAVLEAAAKECESRSRYHPADTPIERAMLAESKYCAYDIRALEFKHHE